MRHNFIYSVLVIAITTFVLIVPAYGGGVSVVNETTIPTTCSTVTYSAPSGTANNIVFAFDKPYICGQFANGDWWVAPNTGDSGVTITAISPTAASGHNGYEVNPTSVTQQGYEISAEVPYNAAFMPALPLTITADSSVVKAVSYLPAGRPQLQFAAVLTILTTPLANSDQYFRPPYFGTSKPLRNISTIDIAKLPKYAATGLPAVPSYTIAHVADLYQRVQLDNWNSFLGRDMHPMDNIPNDYGAQIATNSGVALTRLLLDDFDYAIPIDKLALINYLQMAIDLKSMADGGNTWPQNGGHANGRKLPLVFAGWILNDSSFSTSIAASEFSEDTQIWRSPVTGKVLFGVALATDYAYWKDTLTGSGSQTGRDPYGYVDGGGYQIGADYQSCCTSMPWKYTVLALYMTGLTTQFDPDNRLAEYVERWVSSGAIATPDPCAPYDGNPANYGITFGPDGKGGCIPGSGRWPSANGINANNGGYQDTFGNQLWDWWKKTHP